MTTAPTALRGLGLALALTLTPGCAEDDPLDLPAGTPVVMIVIDTLSARHLPWHGYELDTAPNLARLAEHATVFAANTTQCNSTFPSITSILTGLYPRTHANLLAVPAEGTFDLSRSDRSLAERLVEAGYHAIAVASHPSWKAEPATDAVRRGWHHFSVIPEDVSEPRPLWANAGYTNERIFTALEAWERDPQGPLFLWAHYFDPHTDLYPLVYCPPPGWRDRFLGQHLDAVGYAELEAELAALDPVERTERARELAADAGESAIHLANGRALYDAEIAYCDAEIQHLFDRLDELGILERALVIVMADHGENLVGRETEQGSIAFTHRRLFEPVAHTPLLVRLPGQRAGRRVEAITQNIDVLPTILELLDLPVGPAVEGRSLAPLLADSQASVHDEVWIESSDNIEKALRTDRWKYVDADGERSALLFSWRDDALEHDDLLEGEPDVTAALAARMQAFRPRETLRIRLEPDAEPYEVAIAVELPGSAIRDARDGAGQTVAGVSVDGQRFDWTGRVATQPIDLFLLLKNRKPPVSWRIERDGRAPAPGSVWMGQVPVERTAAIPLFGPGAPAGDEPVLVRVDEDPAAGEVAIAIAGDAARREIELRYARPGYKKRLTTLSSENLAEPETGAALKLVLRAAGPGPARARVAYDPGGGELLVLPRLDGAWPQAAALVRNGRRRASDALEFLWPPPNDPRLNAHLLAAPSTDDLPPGTIAIWRTGGGAVAFDAARLDPDLAAELRALGYIGDE